MDSTVLVAIITSCMAFLGVVFTTLFNAVISRKNAKEARRLAEETRQALNNAQMAKYEKHIEDGVQCLLRAEIIRSNEKYTARRYCPVYAKESLKRVYTAYHNLGGNDVATHLYDELMELPERKDDENES